MKILLVSSYYYPAENFGGPIPVMLEMVQHFKQKGHSVTVYVSNLLDFKTKMSNQTISKDIDGTTVYYGNSVWNYRSFAITPDFRTFCLEQMQNYDIVHLYELRSFQVLAASFYARKLGIPYVIQTIGSVPNILRSQFKKWVFDTLFSKRIFKHAAIGIAKTELEREQMIAGGFSPEKIVIVPNGFSLPIELSKTKKGEFRKKWNLPTDSKIILFIGRITEVKGVDVLIKAFSQIKEKNTFLVLAGNDEGSYGEMIRKQIADLNITKNVIFTGFIKGETKYEALLDSDLFVLPSRQENFPRVILEAISAGVPVIATTNCGLADKIENRVGKIVETGDDRKLAEAMNSLLNDPLLCAQYKKEMPQILQNEFGWEGPISQLIDLHLSIIKNHSGGRQENS